MRRTNADLAALALIAAALAAPARTRAAPALELHGTISSMGVIVTLSGEDADRDAAAALSYRPAGAGEYRPALPLSRVAPARFVGSLFFLAPGAAYDVRVTFSDPDGPPLDGASVSGTGATRAEPAIPAPSASWYAAPTGAGSACTLASPCALATALSQVQAGQAVVLRGGVYRVGGLLVPRSGAEGAPIVIRGHPGESAILDGGDPATFTWTSQGGGVYRTTVSAADPHLVTADGQRLYPYASLSALQALAWDGLPGFHAAGTTLYVHLAGGADPGARAMVVSRFGSAVTVQGQHHVAFADLTFRNYGLGDYAKALYLDGASDVLVQGCTFTMNDLGIGLKRDAHRNVIQDSTFSDTDYAWPWDAVKDGSGLETGGIRMYDPMTGRGTVIRRNTFHDYFDGLGVCPESTAGLTNETDVHDNLIYRAGDDGMETDGRCSNVRIWRNTLHDVLAGISLAPVTTGPVYAVRNLIYRTGLGNSAYDGLSFKLNVDGDPSGEIFLFHNTADAVTAGSSGLALRAPGSWTRLHARNNVWSGAAYAIENQNPGEPLDLDHDDLWTTQPGELAWWAGLADPHLNTLEELRAATGQERSGLSVAPGFAAPAAGDYRLAAGSPLIDRGVPIPGIDDDYAGTAPDVGAFESSAPPVAVTGVCGPAAGATVASAPTAGLCAAGDATVVSGTGPWSWTCRGRNDGGDAACAAAASGGSSGGSSGGGGGGGAGGGCETGGGPAPWAVLVPMALAARRRRRPA